MKPFISQTLTVPMRGGIRLHTEAAGPQDGPLVVLLHGFPETWAAWDNQIGPLSQSGLRVVTPDQRGYNLSSRPRGVEAYATPELVQDIVDLIDAFGRQKAIIVGHDWGGLVAWRLAMHHPERVDRLVILNAPHPAAYTQSLRNISTGQILSSWYVYMFQVPGLAEFFIRLFRYQPLMAAVRATAQPGAFSRPELLRLRKAWARPAADSQVSALTGMINWYRAAAREPVAVGRKEYISRIQVRVTVPTLILWGERDPSLAPELAQMSLKWCNNGRLVRFPEATHWLQHEEPERVTNRLLDFLEDIYPVE